MEGGKGEREKVDSVEVGFSREQVVLVVRTAIDSHGWTSDKIDNLKEPTVFNSGTNLSQPGYQDRWWMAVK